jgi:CheY-like chemotaxis protein
MIEEGMQIIVIEDNEDDAARLVKFLHSHFNNKVVVISDGADAVNFLLFNGDTKPMLVLLDLVLPSVDGIEIFNIIRSEPESRSISVIFMVSSLHAKDYIESLGLHPDGYWRKATCESDPCRIE